MSIKLGIIVTLCTGVIPWHTLHNVARTWLDLQSVAMPPAKIFTKTFTKTYDITSSQKI